MPNVNYPRPKIGETLDCGHVFDDPKSSGASGFAIDRTTLATSCYPCAERDEQAAFLAAGAAKQPYTGYVSSDGQSITTWTGGELAHVVRSRKCRLPRWSYFHGHHYYSITARDSDGRRWYGRSSPGICITLRPSIATGATSRSTDDTTREKGETP